MTEQDDPGSLPGSQAPTDEQRGLVGFLFEALMKLLGARRQHWGAPKETGEGQVFLHSVHMPLLWNLLP